MLEYGYIAVFTKYCLKCATLSVAATEVVH